MTSASSLAFPGSRTLASWWRQLAPFEPQTLCVGYVFLHRVEAQAAWLEPELLDALYLHVLEALTLEQTPGLASNDFFGRLHQRLNLEVPVLRRLTRALTEWQLLEPAAPDRAEALALTDKGRQALASRFVWKEHWKRGVFPFVERFDPSGQRVALPHFLKILDAPSSLWHVEEKAAFDVAWLYSCPGQPVDWKKTYGFPLEVVGFADSRPAAGQAVAWERVVVDRAERLLLVFCQGPGPHEELLAFSVRPEGWALNALEPIMRLPRGTRAVFPDLDSDALDPWRRAWEAWCQTRSVLSTDVKECSLTRAAECLRIEAPESPRSALAGHEKRYFQGRELDNRGRGIRAPGSAPRIGEKALALLRRLSGLHTFLQVP